MTPEFRCHGALCAPGTTSTFMNSVGFVQALPVMVIVADQVEGHVTIGGMPSLIDRIRAVALSDDPMPPGPYGSASARLADTPGRARRRRMTRLRGGTARRAAERIARLPIGRPSGRLVDVVRRQLRRDESELQRLRATASIPPTTGCATLPLSPCTSDPGPTPAITWA
jgi:hypothetical protein